MDAATSVSDTASAQPGETGILLRGRYRLAEVLGVGGMAAVYRARDELLNRDVAVKVFRASAIDQNDIDRQEDEIKLVSRLNHHSLITVIDAGVHLAESEQPQTFLVMELVDGEDLKQRLARAPLSPRQVAQIGLDLAEGLEYLQHAGVVHRDIKPANILLVDYSEDNTRPRAKLTDFGIAKTVESPELTDGVTTGTVAYLSPEQARGRKVGPASDVYSLGLVLLECHTGRPAFPGDMTASVLARLKRNPVIPATLSEQWRTLLGAMTSMEAEDRPPLREIVLLLRDLLLSEVGRHRAGETPGLLIDEEERMAAVRRYAILDTPQDGAFDRITALAARAFSAPISIVSIVDHDRIWFKSHHGTELEQIDRDLGLCASAILQDHPWIVEDARKDPRALANPLVAGEFGLQFYAGVPLHTSDGYNLGTLCVLDFEPRKVSEQELATLEDLAAMVIGELELRLESRRAVAALTP